MLYYIVPQCFLILIPDEIAHSKFSKSNQLPLTFLRVWEKYVCHRKQLKLIKLTGLTGLLDLSSNLLQPRQPFTPKFDLFSPKSSVHWRFDWSIALYFFTFFFFMMIFHLNLRISDKNVSVQCYVKNFQFGDFAFLCQIQILHIISS